MRFLRRAWVFGKRYLKKEKVFRRRAALAAGPKGPRRWSHDECTQHKSYSFKRHERGVKGAGIGVSIHRIW